MTYFHPECSACRESLVACGSHRRPSAGQAGHREQGDQPMTQGNQGNQVIRAGRVILAVADRDNRQLIETMYETMNEPAGIVGLVASLAEVSIGFAQRAAGDDWRAVLSAALNVLDLEGAVDLDDPDDDPDEAA